MLSGCLVPAKSGLGAAKWGRQACLSSSCQGSAFIMGSLQREGLLDPCKPHQGNGCRERWVAVSNIKSHL